MGLLGLKVLEITGIAASEMSPQMIQYCNCTSELCFCCSLKHLKNHIGYSLKYI